MPDQERRGSGGQVAEGEGQAEPVAGAEGLAAHAGGVPGEFVQVGRPVGMVGLGQAQRGHAEQPVGVQELVEPFRAGRGMGGAVGAGVGGQDTQGGVGLLGGDLPELALGDHEEAVLVAGVADDQLDAGRGSVGQSLPGRGGQHLAVHDGREGRLKVRGLAPSRVGGHRVGHLVRGVRSTGRGAVAPVRRRRKGGPGGR